MYAGEVTTTDAAPVSSANICACGTPISPHSRGSCIKCGHAKMRRGVPDDFAEILRRLGSQGAAKHYKTSLSTLTRWRRECGMAKHHRAKPSAGTGMRRTGFAERPLMHARDMSFVGRSADYLRRYGSIHRCNHDGSFNPKGDHWRRNNRVVTSDHIVKIAINLGFRYEYDIAPGEVPAGFASVAETGVRNAEKFFGLSRRTVAQWKRERCPAPRGARRKDTPTDLTTISGRLSLRAMADHYQVSKGTVIRWLREADVSIAERKSLGKRLNS
ncbi:hypothetical protein [Novosphingobium resinovorum]|uniref:Uncharacterized protein n=1 Tax=Novosphingobium resinovorum TaxID=158500 RepID=A0A1D8A2I4_9SPHN|nr:hypothetical protein [Novosphingobium resinovorum]AOR76327.1 hypothetical protein BES08_05795 [Novosphingobium resinovorum]